MLIIEGEPDKNKPSIRQIKSFQPAQSGNLKKSVTIERAKGWNTAFTDLNNLIRIKHYSPKTLKAYTNWLKKFRGFTYNKDIQLLSPSDVKEFLEYLAKEI